MSISADGRKEGVVWRLPRGAQREIALATGLHESVVSRVVNDRISELAPETVRKVQVAIARKLRLRRDKAFPESQVA